MSVAWDVNYIAVIVAAIASMAIGWVYYMPAVMGRAWLNAIGMTEEKMKATMTPQVLGTGFVLALIQASVLAAAIGWAGANSLGGGITVGLVVWLGFVLPTSSMNTLYEAKPQSLHWINGLNGLITFAVMGAIIGWWRGM